MSSNPAPTAIVVDDSHFMRTVIADMLESGGIDVVALAKDGADAIELVAEHEPDVVTMDVEMPGVDGIEAVERIMDANPTPILMLSAHTEEDAAVTFEALERGAVDFFTKPGGEISTEMGQFEEQLVRKVASVAATTVGPDGVQTTAPAALTDVPTTAFLDDPTLVVGSSTGGPQAVEALLEALPRETDFRVLIVQHMPEGFTARFATRLDSGSAYEVAEAEDGATISGGEAVVARGGYHLVVSKYRNGRLRIGLTEEPRVNGVRPSIDVTMGSAARAIDDPLVAVVLTGMGADGADGIEQVKAAGGFTIAQDESTSAVFGMPRRAIETGSVDTVEPLSGIPRAIVQSISREAVT